MSARKCAECGYDLSGLPAEGTVVTCPECKHLTDLAILPPNRGNEAAPFFWGLLPVALGAAGSVLSVQFDRGNPLVPGAAGMLGGAIISGMLTYKASKYAPEMGWTPRSPWSRFVVAVRAAMASVIANAAVMILVVVLLAVVFSIIRR